MGRQQRTRRAGAVGLPVLVVVATLAAAVLVGCGGSSGGGGGTDRVAGVYLAALRWAAASLTPAPPPTDDEDEGDEADAGPHDPPVVYALGLNGQAIAVAVQAVVAKHLRDDVNVRFVDDRDDVLDGDPDERVHDGGLLVSLGEVPDEGDDVTLEAELYRSADDSATYELRVHLNDDVWEVASASPR